MCRCSGRGEVRCIVNKWKLAPDVDAEHTCTVSKKYTPLSVLRTSWTLSLSHLVSLSHLTLVSLSLGAQLNSLPLSSVCLSHLTVSLSLGTTFPITCGPIPPLSRCALVA
jgi:hypothetical protein